MANCISRFIVGWYQAVRGMFPRLNRQNINSSVSSKAPPCSDRDEGHAGGLGMADGRPCPSTDWVYIKSREAQSRNASAAHFVETDDDGHASGLGVADGLLRLRPNAVVRRHHDDGDVRHLCATRAHRAEGLHDVGRSMRFRVSASTLLHTPAGQHGGEARAPSRRGLRRRDAA